MSVIDEKYLEDYPKTIFIESIENILKQMKKSIFKICTKKGTKGTGFFCKIPLLKENKFINTFMTNYHVIEEENEIEIKINNGKLLKKLNFKNNNKYSEQKQDIVIIEINEDFNDLIDYLELDNNVLNDNNINYIGNTIYTIHYPSSIEWDKVGVSFGILKHNFLDKDKEFDFNHYCATERGSSGSPIINSSNNKIIGIHKQSSINNGYNIGLFLSNSVKAFTKIYLEKNKNPSDSANKKINDKVDISSNFNNYTFKDISDNKKLKPHNISKKIINSKIVKFDDIIFIEERLKDINPKIKGISFYLVYRATEDGDKASDFHKKCDKIGPNIVIIKTIKGNIFGGFTFRNWEHLPRDIDSKKPNLGSASRDSNAFAFNINAKKIYNNAKPKEYAIWCNINYGPTFKNNLFQIFDHSLKKGGYCGKKEKSNFGGQMYDYEISGGEETYKVEELEAFEVKFIY